jgi:hypothetical protein
MTAERKALVEAAPRACAHCPWRLSNQGQPHPHGFYSKRNLARLWAGLRSGNAPGMTCHPTDPLMAEFEGYEETADREETLECRGSIILMTREVMRFQAICHQVERGELEQNALREYRAAAPLGLQRAGLAEIVSRFLLGGTPLARAVQCDSNQVNDPEVGYPPLGEWDPGILDEAMRR